MNKSSKIAQPPSEFIHIINELAGDPPGSYEKVLNNRIRVAREKSPDTLTQWLLYIISNKKFAVKLKYQSIIQIGDIAYDSWEYVTSKTKKILHQEYIRLLQEDLDSLADHIIGFMCNSIISIKEFNRSVNLDLDEWNYLPTLLVNATKDIKNEHYRANAFLLIGHLYSTPAISCDITIEQSQMIKNIVKKGYNDKSILVRENALDAAISVTAHSPSGHEEIFQQLIPWLVSLLYGYVTNGNYGSVFTFFHMLYNQVSSNSSPWLKSNIDQVTDILFNILRDSTNIKYPCLKEIFLFVHFNMNSNKELWSSEEKRNDVVRWVQMYYKWSAELLKETRDEWIDVQDYIDNITALGFPLIYADALGIIAPVMMNQVRDILSDGNSYDWSFKEMAMRSYSSLIKSKLISFQDITESLVKLIISLSKSDHIHLKYPAIVALSDTIINIPVDIAQRYLDLIAPEMEYYIGVQNSELQLHVISLATIYYPHLKENNLNNSEKDYKTIIRNYINSLCQSSDNKILEIMEKFIYHLIDINNLDYKLFAPYLLKAHEDGIFELKSEKKLRTGESDQSTRVSGTGRRKQIKKKLPKQLITSTASQSTDNVNTILSNQSTNVPDASSHSRINFLGYILTMSKESPDDDSKPSHSTQNESPSISHSNVNKEGVY